MTYSEKQFLVKLIKKEKNHQISFLSSRFVEQPRKRFARSDRQVIAPSLCFRGCQDNKYCCPFEIFIINQTVVLSETKRRGKEHNQYHIGSSRHKRRFVSLGHTADRLLKAFSLIRQESKKITFFGV